MRTIEAVIDAVGNVQLLEPVQLSASHRALVTILEDTVPEEDERVEEIEPQATSSSLQERPFGLCAGDFTVPDDFDEPLPIDIIKLFEGE